MQSKFNCATSKTNAVVLVNTFHEICSSLTVFSVEQILLSLKEVSSHVFLMKDLSTLLDQNLNCLLVATSRCDNQSRQIGPANFKIDICSRL